tara:strand:- start:172 stop:357 length:186 start_codon:yes stop_codon:yes gene_type:complete
MGNKQTTMDYQILKSMRVDDTLIELVHNVHCEHYELVIDGIPVFNSKEMIHVDHEYQMEVA